MSSGQYNPPPGPPPQQQQQYGQSGQQPYGAQQQQFGQQQPNPPPRRTDTEQFLPTGQDRTEQMEYLQSYEASATQTDDDKNQETLQKEFPSVDGSLVAAIYSDTKDMSQTREMLQELVRQEGSS